MKLRYTIRAAAELDEILTSIDEQSPQGARHVKERLRAVIDLLLHIRKRAGSRAKAA